MQGRLASARVHLLVRFALLFSTTTGLRGRGRTEGVEGRERLACQNTAYKQYAPRPWTLTAQLRRTLPTHKITKLQLLLLQGVLVWWATKTISAATNLN